MKLRLYDGRGKTFASVTDNRCIGRRRIDSVPAIDIGVTNDARVIITVVNSTGNGDDCRGREQLAEDAVNRPTRTRSTPLLFA